MMVRGTLLLLLLFCLLSDLSWRSLSAAAPVPVPAPAPPAAGGSESVQAATAIPVLVSCDFGDQNFLLQFKGALDNGDAKLADWLNDRSCCVWPGVDCSVNSTGSETQGGLAGSLSQDQRRVRHLRLPGMGLTGRVSNLTWANLSALLSLDLSFNNLTGPLPAGLAQLEVLEKLSLGSNNFSGGVEVLADCRSLLELDVSNNNLSGALPSTFASSNLEKLDLSGNKFGDPWPGLSNMDNLQVLNVSHNNVTAGMPVFRNCSALREIDLSQNGFSGTLETDICALKPNLLLLNLSENALAGDLPSSISLCSSLETLDLGYNSLGGRLPPAIFDLGNLTTLCLPNNQFVGVLGPAISNLTNLRRVLLSTNNFTGAIPAEVGMLKKLERMDLSFNFFSGGIPPELSNCTQLISFAVRRNSLFGPIELAFDKLPALTMLDLSFNSLSGEIPSTISLCSELQSLSLSSNSLTGSIPPQLGGLKKLVSLALSNNSLVGGIPTELDGCTSLVSLILTKNPSLGGEVPANMSPLPNLQLLAIGVCGLDGSIPDWIGACSKLQLLDLSWNNFTGQLPGWISKLEYLIYLDLSNNSLSGVLPVNLSASPSFSGQQVNASGLVEVTTLVLFVTRNVTAGPQRYTRLSGFPPSLILAYNEFYGFIPPEYGKLQKVMALDLSHNRLSGHIPDTLSNMSSLYSLNLADNILSGNIPPSFSALNFLALFNVSNNNLSGPIPDGTQFSSFSELSFLNNPFLCGSPLERKCDEQLVQVPADAIVPKKQEGFSKKAILGLTIGVGLGMAVVLALLTRCLLYRRQERQPTEEEEESEYTEGMVSFSVDLYLNDQLSKLSPADLVKATNNFDQSNIIGCGGFGLVFRATLSDGTHVAIKRLSGDTGQAEREVQAELLTLGQIQHRNLVALQGYCRFGSDRLLIYNYMENGSLDYWLHERTDGGLKLDWPMRRKIALGTARGLAYLHQMCEPHIVHRDIKSSNILLNEKFEAHLCDFGLARHLANTDTHVTTELVGTLGYIPPEYGQAWIATLRGDVYSFGVVVLELLTRRRPVEVSRKKGVADLVSWVQDMRIKGTPEEVFDVLLKHQGYENEMLQVLEVAIMCVNHSPQKRPTIRDVEYMLEQVGKDPADKEAKNPADLFV